MPYMIYQQYTTAIKENYAGDEAVAELHRAARSCREWLATLQLEDRLLDPLLGPIAAIEEAFGDLQRDSQDG